MPRDQAGRPQETGKLPAASKVAPDSTATSAHCPHCSEHRDRWQGDGEGRGELRT
jgi:hypothetical protein